MENHIFLRPAVAGLMQQNFVEARTHTDTQLTDEQLAVNRKLQRELAGSIANPYFVVVDPRTGQTLGEHALSGGANAWEAGWITFLQEMLVVAGRAKPADHPADK